LPQAEPIRPGERDEDRHDRTRRIPWVNFERISSAKVLVVGAGALGNESVKDLVLFGFRHLDILDMDSVVRSNLSRCVLFREGDQSSGKGKASLVAERARELDPEVRARAIEGRVQSMGSEEMNGYDVISVAWTTWRPGCTSTPTRITPGCPTWTAGRTVSGEGCRRWSRRSPPACSAA
jgi:hypothetical protein